MDCLLGTYFAQFSQSSLKSTVTSEPGYDLTMLPMVRYICERMSASSKSSPLFDNVLVNFLSISLTSSSGNEVSKIAGVDKTTWCNKPSIELSPAEEDNLREDDVTDDDVESVRLGIKKKNSIIKRWSEAESFNIKVNHDYIHLSTAHICTKL